MKFYSEIMALAARFFGLTADATESEVHQALTEASTYEELKAKATAEAGVTLEKVNEITGSLETLNKQVADMQAENEGKSEQITALDTKVNDLTAALSEKDKTIEAQKAEIESLSGRLAEYKVKGKAPGTGDSPAPNDQGLPVREKAATSRQVVSNEQFQSMFN